MEKGNTNLYLKNLGKNIKSLRESRGLSLRDLAAECGIDHSDIGKMEKGEKNITFLTMVELASALDITVKKLVDFPLDEL